MLDYDKKRILQYLIETALPECSKGNKKYLGVMQRIFVYADEKQLQVKAAAINEEILSRITVKDLIWLSENFRSRQWDVYYACNTEYWNIDFGRKTFWHLSDGQYEALLKFGTFMANGHGRQECMERIGNTKGALPFLILRMNDWVEQIRDKAFVLARQRLDACSIYELFLSLPMLEKVEYAGRRDADRLYSLKEQVECVIRQKFSLTEQEELDAVHQYDPTVKNAIYRFVNKSKVLGQEQMERLLSLEREGYGKGLLIRGIFRHYGCDREQMEGYLASKNAIVRYHALLYRYETEQDAWEGLEKMLLDPSKRIRGYAAYILVKRKGMDIIAYYMQELQHHVTKTALLGIGENGTKQEIETILPFLESEEQQLCKAALIAYGNLATDSGGEIYWRFLCTRRCRGSMPLEEGIPRLEPDHDPVIARQAYRLIQKYRIPYPVQDLYDGFEQNRGKALGEYFLKLLLCAPSWQRLPYLLQLYCDAKLSDEWHGMILKKISYRDPYAKISRQQAQVICNILEQNEQLIPQEVSKGIRFDLKYVTGAI